MNVLFVCTGNTCRSPMAEGYLKSLGIENITVKSKGLSANNEKVSKNSVLSMKEINIDISSLFSEQLNLCDIAWADKIICMSESHKTVLCLYADSKKVSVLGGGIPDPFGQDLSAYKKCLQYITDAIDNLLKDNFFYGVQIKALEIDNIADVAECEKICFSCPWSKESLIDAYNNNTSFFVAVEGDKVIGYIGINCILDEGYITNIAVLPESREKGVGTALINRVFSLASDLNLSFVSLEVRESNSKAINLYKNLGFKTEGKRKNFYNKPKEDALIMTKRFEQK